MCAWIDKAHHRSLLCYNKSFIFNWGDLELTVGNLLRVINELSCFIPKLYFLNILNIPSTFVEDYEVYLVEAPLVAQQQIPL